MSTGPAHELAPTPNDPSLLDETPAYSAAPSSRLRLRAEQHRSGNGASAAAFESRPLAVARLNRPQQNRPRQARSQHLDSQESDVRSGTQATPPRDESSSVHPVHETDRFTRRELLDATELRRVFSELATRAHILDVVVSHAPNSEEDHSMKLHQAHRLILESGVHAVTVVYRRENELFEERFERSPHGILHLSGE